MSDVSAQIGSHKKPLTQRQKAFLAILEQYLGVVAPACAEANIDRQTFYNWKRDNETFAQAVADLDNVVLDFAENQLFARMKDKSDAAIIFFLKCRGKRRGYVEKQELRIDLNSLTPEQALAILEADSGEDSGCKPS